MLNDITFGQYFPSGSFIHKLNPAVKMVLCIALIVLIFLANNAVSLLICAVLTFTLAAFSKIPVRMYLKSLKPIWPVIALTAVLNACYIRSGILLWDWWIFHITTGGILTAVYMATRISMLIIISSMLTYTTSPTDLSCAVETLLAPLKVVGLDVHSLAMMMTISLRFIPILIEETDKIMSAQKARGADMESGGLKKRIKSLLPVFIPLLISSFRRAGELADAMECRCYHGGKGRTRMKKNTVKAADIISLVFIACMFVAVILADRRLDGLILSLVKG